MQLFIHLTMFERCSTKGFSDREGWEVALFIRFGANKQKVMTSGKDNLHRGLEHK